LLEKALKEEKITNIQIFINCIFNDLMNLIISSGDMKTIEQRYEFEDNINSIVKNAIENYNENSRKYKEVIEKIKIKYILY